MIRLALVVVAAFAALPPGYEDKLLCPAGYCKRGKKMPAGWAGPRSAFHECYNKATNDVRAVTPWGSRNGGSLKLTALNKSGFTENECKVAKKPTKVTLRDDCVDLMHDKAGGKNYCATHLIPEFGCKHGIALHGCKKSCGACKKGTKDNSGCCVSYGFGAFMKECCHQYKTVQNLGACNSAQRMGGATVFEGNTCEASQLKHEGPSGCCVSFGLGAGNKEVAHKYNAVRQNHCHTEQRMGGRTVFENMDCKAATLKHQSTHDTAQDPGCCVSYGFGSMMKPCCHKFSAMKRGTCMSGRRRGGATKFEVSYDKTDACAASKLKVKKMMKADDSN